MDKTALYIDALTRLLDVRCRELAPAPGSVGCSIGQVKSFDAKTRTLTGLVSTPNVDRYEEIVLPSAFAKRLDSFMSNPVFVAGHVYGGADGQPTTIGHWTDMKVTSEGLVGTAKFLEPGDALADAYFARYQQGAMRAFSVGWLTHEYEMREVATPKGKQKIRHFTDVELIEVSAVAIPANREALVRPAAFGAATAGSADQPTLDLIRDTINKTLTDPTGPMEVLIAQVVDALLARGTCFHDHDASHEHNQAADLMEMVKRLG